MPVTERIIETPACVAEGAAYLAGTYAGAYPAYAAAHAAMRPVWRMMAAGREGTA